MKYALLLPACLFALISSAFAQTSIGKPTPPDPLLAYDLSYECRLVAAGNEMRVSGITPFVPKTASSGGGVSVLGPAAVGELSFSSTQVGQVSVSRDNSITTLRYFSFDTAKPEFLFDASLALPIAPPLQKSFVISGGTSDSQSHGYFGDCQLMIAKRLRSSRAK